MSLSYKQTLKEKLGVIAPKYSMMELMFPSFYRHYGYKATLSASDIVYSIGALLDAGAEWVSKHGTKHERVGLNKTLDENVGRGMAGVGAGTRTGFAAVDMHVLESLSTFKSSTVDKVSKDTLDPEADSEESLAAKKDRDQEWIVNFYVAYDALDKYAFVCAMLEQTLKYLFQHRPSESGHPSLYTFPKVSCCHGRVRDRKETRLNAESLSTGCAQR